MHSPVVTRFEPRAEADYRMNGMDWKGTDITLSHTVGMWWTCKVIIASGTQQHIHLGEQKHGSQRQSTFIYWHLWVIETPGCTLGELFFKKVKMKVLTPNSEHSICQSNTKGWSIRSNSWHWHMVLNVYMYRPDVNRWSKTDEQHMHRIQTVLLDRHTRRG